MIFFNARKEQQGSLAGLHLGPGPSPLISRQESSHVTLTGVPAPSLLLVFIGKCPFSSGEDMASRTPTIPIFVALSS